MSMGPVVELSGEIHDVEDLGSHSSVMQSSESSMSIHDEDGAPGDAAGSAADSRDRKKKMRRFYAMALVLVTLFVGCTYAAVTFADSSSTSSGNDSTKATSALSIKKNSSPSADKELTSPMIPHEVPDLASGDHPALAIGASRIAEMPPGPIAAAEAVPVSAKAILQSGSEFQIQDAASTLCFDLNDDAESLTITLQKCNPERTSQAFLYDPFNSFILSKTRPGFCIGNGSSRDGRLLSALAADRRALRALHLLPCGFARAWHQTFHFDLESATFRSSQDICMDTMASASLRAGSQAPLAANLSPCDPSQRRQRLELLPISDTDVWDVGHPVLQAKDTQFLVRSTGKADLCLGGSDSTRLEAVRCSPSDDAQLFVYNAQNHWIQSASNDAMCLDDNDSWLGGDSKPMRMAPCDEVSVNQHFVYDAFAMAVRSPGKSQLCLDDGGGDDINGVPSVFRFVQCDLSSGYQQFQIVARSALLSISPLALLTSFAPFVVESVNKGLCIGASSSSTGDEELRLEPCDSRAVEADQGFQYYAELQLLKSSKRPGYCWSSTNDFDLMMARCDPQSSDQLFMYDAATERFQSATDEKLCVDDGGGWFPGETRLALLPCEESSVHQQFHLRAA